MKRFLFFFFMFFIMISVFSAVSIEKISNNTILPNFSKAKVGDYLIKNEKISFIVGSEKRKDIYRGKIIEAYTNDLKRNLIDNYKIFIQNKMLSFESFNIKKRREYIEFTINNREFNGLKISTIYSLKKDKNYIEITNKIINNSKNKAKILIKDIVSFNELFPIIIKTKEKERKLLMIQENLISYSFLSDEKLISLRTLFSKNFGGIIYKPFYLEREKEINVSRKMYITKDIEEVRSILYSNYNTIYGKIIGKINSKEFIPILAYDKNNNPVSLKYTDKNGDFSFSNLDFEGYLSFEKEGFLNQKLMLKTKKARIIKIIPEFISYNFVWPPYLTNHTQNSVILNWKTNIPSTAKIELYNENRKLIKTIVTIFPANINHVEIKDLDAGKKYFYSINIKNYYIYSDLNYSGSFKTKSIKDENLKFAIYGDTRTYHEWHTYVAKKIAQDNPEFVINTGDLVEKGDYLPDWNSFFKEIKELSKKSIYYPLLGNHERNNSYYYQAFYLPNGSGDYNKRWYYFDYKRLRLIFLDSNAIGTKQLEEKQFNWLIKTLEDAKNKTVLVFYHHPFWNNCKGYNYGMEIHLEELWRPLFEKYGVKAIFNGHVHSYERHKKNNIIYVITGGGGAPLEIYTNKTKVPTTVNLNYGSLHYILAEIKNNEIFFTVKGVAKIKNKNNDRDLEKIDFIIDTFKIPIK
ncbi:hypothetical protein X275_10135 [Marinitoga sp. 1197]|uniref:metallophosphoesterase family protein n=1 Tax=Marinitoga sp. 1197 TaxID=1428449 RepID=UPI0006412B2E|nr:metallophosphoesterase [Marinitoga sp. 1197]KLO21103.1 hypothetical protein X275_10135 [Marinitoga sp. 1197]